MTHPWDSEGGPAFRRESSGDRVMTNTAWTPGPWEATRSYCQIDGAFDFAIDAPGMPVIAEAFGRASNGQWPNAYANARLIAAAPELAEALARAVSWIDYATPFMRPTSHEWDMIKGLMEDARAALAKAKGETA